MDYGPLHPHLRDIHNRFQLIASLIKPWLFGGELTPTQHAVFSDVFELAIGPGQGLTDVHKVYQAQPSEVDGADVTQIPPSPEPKEHEAPTYDPDRTTRPPREARQEREPRTY